MKKYLIISLLFLMTTAFAVRGQETMPIQGIERTAIVDSLTNAVIEWEQVGLSGKLRNDRLPVRPTLKFYMVRGQEMIGSLRVPLFGELGRVEVVGDEVTVINKHNRTYFRGSLSNLTGSYGAMLEDVQNFLLGEPVIFGSGVVSDRNEKDYTLYDSGDGAIIIKPKESIPGADYGYLIGDDYLPALLMGSVGTGNNFEIGYSFSYNGKYMMEFLYQGSRKSLSADIEFDEPDFSPRPIERMRVDSKYREVTVKEFLNQLANIK